MSLFTPQSVLEERFDADARVPLTPRYNIAPREDVVVITNDAPDAIDHFEWGLLPSWVDDPDDYSYPINARAETVAEKPTFAEAFEQRRCLVLADGFYEWQDTPTGKQPYRVQRADGDPFAMAGLWERWEGRGQTRETVTVVTTEPNDLIADLHHRMAVILDGAETETWLAEADPATHRALLDPYPSDPLESYPVSTAVNDPSNDDPSIVEEIDPGTQQTFGDFT